jgi:hypothetical protein
MTDSPDFALLGWMWQSGSLVPDILSDYVSVDGI